MKLRTFDEIELFFYNMQGVKEVEVRSIKRQEAVVKVKTDGDGFNFRQLFAIAAFFESRNIEDDRYDTEGCETCGYGAIHEITLTVTPDPEYAKILGQNLSASLQ